MGTFKERWQTNVDDICNKFSLGQLDRDEAVIRLKKLYEQLGDLPDDIDERIDRILEDVE